MFGAFYLSGHGKPKLEAIDEIWHQRSEYLNDSK